MSRVGEKIKEARTKSGITQKALGKKLGVSDKYINDVELGRKVAAESFIDKVSKLLQVDLNDINMVVTDEDLMEERKQEQLDNSSKNKIKTKTLGEVSEVWTDAFSSVLKKVNIYDYNLTNIIGSIELPNYSNKVLGYPADKVLYLKIQNNDMSGFRIMKEDLAFAHIVKEVTGSGIFLIEYNGARVIRQLKTIGNSRVLIVSNSGGLITETVDLNSIQIIAKLEKIEISL